MAWWPLFVFFLFFVLFLLQATASSASPASAVWVSKVVCEQDLKEIFAFQFIFHKRHTCLSTLGEREKECPPGVNYCELRFNFPCTYLIANSALYLFKSYCSTRFLNEKTIRLRIRNQNKYYHNRGRADGLSGWPQNYEVNFRGCGTPYQTQGKTLIQMCCNLTNCLPSGDAYNNNQEFQEVSEIVLTTQPDWPLSDCREHKRSKVQGRSPWWSDSVEVGVLYTPLSIDRSGWPTCLI